jgi:hypothetical protein
MGRKNDPFTEKQESSYPRRGISKERLVEGNKKRSKNN